MTDPTRPSADILAILEARHGDPFGFLGRQPAEGGASVVRTFQPKAHAVNVVARDGSGELPTPIPSVPSSVPRTFIFSARAPTSGFGTASVRI